MADEDLIGRARAALAAPPLSAAASAQREELLEAAGAADAFEDLPGKWQAAILKAESGEPDGSGRSHCCGGH